MKNTQHNNLNILVKAMGIPMSTLAEGIGFSRYTLYNYVSNKYPVSIESAFKIVDYFNTLGYELTLDAFYNRQPLDRKKLSEFLDKKLFG